MNHIFVTLISLGGFVKVYIVPESDLTEPSYSQSFPGRDILPDKRLLA